MPVFLISVPEQSHGPEDPLIVQVRDTLGEQFDLTSEPVTVEPYDPATEIVGVLAQMADDVYEVNEANGWFDVNPAVAEFLQSLREGGFSPPAIDQVATLATKFFGERTVGDDIALIHTEVSEALEAFRETGLESRYRFQRPGEEGYAYAKPGDANFARWLTDYGLPKPEGFASELADTLVRLLDTAKRRGVNLGEAYIEKLAYNRTRGHRHGGKAL